MRASTASSLLPLPRAPPPLQRPATNAPPCRRGTSGYCGVRQRPNGGFYSEIRSGELRLGLGTFGTAREAARAYDAAAWRLGRPHAQMNFQDVYSL
ncbi:putative AP2 protein [Hordeum vulgare]|nr:putative AP2 protein [Hordeum vulgare]